MKDDYNQMWIDRFIEETKNGRCQWKLAKIWLPKRCAVSNKILWSGIHYQVQMNFRLEEQYSIWVDQGVGTTIQLMM